MPGQGDVPDGKSQSTEDSLSANFALVKQLMTQNPTMTWADAMRFVENNTPNSSPKIRCKGTNSIPDESIYYIGYYTGN